MTVALPAIERGQPQGKSPLALVMDLVARHLEADAGRTCTDPRCIARQMDERKRA